MTKQRLDARLHIAINPDTVDALGVVDSCGVVGASRVAEKALSTHGGGQRQ